MALPDREQVNSLVGLFLGIVVAIEVDRLPGFKHREEPLPGTADELIEAASIAVPEIADDHDPFGGPDDIGQIAEFFRIKKRCVRWVSEIATSMIPSFFRGF